MKPVLYFSFMGFYGIHNRILDGDSFVAGRGGGWWWCGERERESVTTENAQKGNIDINKLC